MGEWGLLEFDLEGLVGHAVWYDPTGGQGRDEGDSTVNRRRTDIRVGSYA